MMDTVRIEDAKIVELWCSGILSGSCYVVGKTMTTTKSVFARPQADNVRSIRIELRGKVVELLLDPKVVLRITDVTDDFGMR